MPEAVSPEASGGALTAAGMLVCTSRDGAPHGSQLN